MPKEITVGGMAYSYMSFSTISLAAFAEKATRPCNVIYLLRHGAIATATC